MKHLNVVVGSALLVGLCVTMVQAQRPDNRNTDPYAARYDRNGRYDAYSPLAEIDAGTYITVRTRQAIDTNRRDGREYLATVETDVWDGYRRLAVPAIPRGSSSRLLVRSAADGDLILDLDSVTVKGRRYAVSAEADRVQAPDHGSSDQAVQRIGGGALLGTIIGAIAGGGKGAAIGAVAGATVGAASLATHGRLVRVPAGSLVTFRLDRALAIGR